MTRKIERHQENFASKNKQQETTYTATGISLTKVDDDYPPIIERSGSNFNVFQKVTGASIDVKNKRAIGDKTILFKGKSELMNLLSSSNENENKNKSRSTTITFNNEICNNNDETSKVQRTNSTNYGPRLQNTGSTLSLDIILGSHIRQNIGINEQKTIVKYSIEFSVMMIIFGLINSILTFFTFQMKTARDIGCGLYLFVSSFTSLIAIIIMTIKFCLLVLTQMG